MLDMAKHVEGDGIFDPAAQGTGQIVCAIAVMMDSPHGEKSGQAVASAHREDMVFQHAAARKCENPCDPDGAHKKFAAHDSGQAPAPATKRGSVQQVREGRPEQQRAPGRHACAAAFHVFFAIIHV